MARWKTHQGTSRIWWHRRVALFYLVDVVWWIFWWEIVGKIVGILAMWRILLGYGDILGISLGMLLVVDIVWRCNLTLKLEDSLNWVPHSILLFKIWIPFFQKLKWPILRTTLLGSGNVGGVRLGKGMWWVGWEWLGDGVIFIGQLYPIVGKAPGFEEGFLHWSRRCKIMTCVIAWPYMSGFLACTVRVMDNRTKSKSDQEWTCYTPKRKPLVKSQNHRTWLSKHPSSRIIWSWEDMLKIFWGATMWHTWNDSGVPWRFSQSWGFSSSG